MRKGLLIIIAALLAASLVSGCTSSRNFNSSLKIIVRPYNFSIFKWELNAVFEEVRQLVAGNSTAGDSGISEVLDYFSTGEEIRNKKAAIDAVNSGSQDGDPALLETELRELEAQRQALEGTAEQVIRRQVREILSQQGIFHPLDKYVGLKVGFPPLNFQLGKPPHLLVVSPRDRIESIREILLLQDISVEEMESIEFGIDEMEVSSLVEELGGFGGTYPAFVTNEASLRFIIDTATEEWLHQYLAFTPLGFRYLLDLVGISRDYEIATINETVAGMVSKEIGAMVYEQYYSGNGNKEAQPQVTESGFDFNREMRDIRRAVDRYLAQGEIEQAEEFMEQKRQYLASQGYYIRKLNQAYFAFHGTYADKPTSISPIGEELKELRAQSASIKDFLETVVVMTSRQDLRNSLN
ncbi:hypothetical protein ACFLXG_04445 [Chloroflexota bacterium]